MIISFTVPGEPKAKARPRMTTTGMAYTPKKTVEYENWVKQCYLIEQKGKKLEGQIKAEIAAYFTIPKSTSKKKRKEMTNYLIRPTKKPDSDNVAKVILDSLNGLAYDDDKQIIDLRIMKFYGEDPRVEVTLNEI